MSPEQRAGLLRQFAWPSAMAATIRRLSDPGAAIDLDALRTAAAKVNNSGTIGVAVLSSEYLHTGLNWINAMHRLGWRGILIIAGDEATARAMDQRGVANARVNIDLAAPDNPTRTSSDFSPKGCALIACKFPVTGALLDLGYSVIVSDVDAIWLRDPLPHFGAADIAFQRIAYHPEPIALQWGFAACGGFVRYRNGDAAREFVARCADQGQLVCSDQVALNLALHDAAPVWSCADPAWRPPEDGATSLPALEATFARFASWPIEGAAPGAGTRFLALPHDTFWRHRIVPGLAAKVVVCHPNSPHDDLAKMRIFDAMGLRFPAVDGGPVPGVT